MYPDSIARDAPEDRFINGSETTVATTVHAAFSKTLCVNVSCNLLQKIHVAAARIAKVSVAFQK